MHRKLEGFTKKETALLKKLNTPQKIQDFVNKLKINFEKNGGTLMSPKMLLRTRKAQCIEAAVFSAFCLSLHKQKALLLDLRTIKPDIDHVVALFRQNGYWGAIAKSNHAVLRYREPVYKTVRELALSFFHEYFLDSGKKTLREYSKPFDLARYNNKKWAVSEKNLWFISNDLDKTKHFRIVPKINLKYLRKADKIEIRAAKLIETEK